MSRIFARAMSAAALGLALIAGPGCDQLSNGQAAKSPATAQPRAPVPKAQKILAQWQAFSLAPPRYGQETLEVYDDMTCALITAQGTRQPCQWSRLAGGRMQIKFLTSGAQVTATLQPAQSRAARQQPGTAGYLLIQTDPKRAERFVLASSPDAAMVRNTVTGELAWAQRRYADAIAILKNSVDAGDTYARLRLGWLLATAPGFQDPALALRLLEPFAQRATYDDQNALAAALAANQRFDEAVTVGSKACELAPVPLKSECAARVAGYRAKRPFLLTLEGVSAAPVAAAEPPPPAEPPAEKAAETRTEKRSGRSRN